MAKRKPWDPVKPTHKPDTYRFGRWLRERREELGISQTQLADMLDTYQASVSLIESGRSGLSIGAYCRLAAALGMDPMEIFSALIRPVREGEEFELEIQPGSITD